MRRALLTALTGATLTLAACGSSTTVPAAQPGTTKPAGTGGYGPYGTPSAAPATTVPVAGAASVRVGDSQAGPILVGPDGRTLYAFTKDSAGTSTCVGGCAEAWPPATVDGPVVVEGGADAALFTTVERSDGTTQLKAGSWPLYYFAGDTAPGQHNGQGSGGSWFVVSQDGDLVEQGL